MASLAVVMATYNGSRWIGEQLESIAAQTRLPERLVVSDDGSSDPTVEIARAFARRAPFEVVVLDGPRRGFAENFWSAAGHADADVVAWCDEDDVWHPRKLEQCERLMAEHGVAFLTHAAEVVDATLTPTGRHHPRFRSTRVVEPLVGDPWTFSPGFATVVTADLIRSVPWADRPADPAFVDGRLAHDEVLSLCAFATIRRLEVSDVLARYRQHACNVDGAPAVHTPRERVRRALAVEPSAFSYQASLAQRYGRFVAGYSPGDERAVAYFVALEQRFERRARVHRASGRSAAACRLAAAVAHGDFGARSRGRFGGVALARDLAALALASPHGDR
ncbi:MAG TPA: glycosyltransferase [Acidimicrobiales bacterium]|nr:glycosyltransferase [Acidimicrobiales bacterium]